MKSLPKWLLIPPAVAILLLLGTLSMQGGPARAEPVAAPAAPANKERPAIKTPAVPRTPDLWQMASALLAVLLLGSGGLLVVRRLRHGAAPATGGTLVTLRQTLRMSPRLSVHALEFDERLLLVGESDRGLVLLDSGKLPDRVADEAEVAARDNRLADAADVEDEGAVPKNLLIPRPSQPPARRLPKPPSTPAATPAPTKPVRTSLLSDFRALLHQATRS
jgi:flagellar biogenesis protein FliO